MTYYGHDIGLQPNPLNPTVRDEAARAKHKAAAEKRGCFCVYPADNELQLDLDGFESIGRWLFAGRLMADLIDSSQDAPSPSGVAGRMHVTVKLKRPVKDKFERIMLQALLGSDPSREALSWKAATEGVECPTLFFERAAP